MKGKSLFYLIQDLDKSEKHRILNNCKRSGDKRHVALYKLIKKNLRHKKQYEDLLEEIARELYEKSVATDKDENEKDKTIRRFIDFAVKEIEHVKLTDLLKTDLKTRNYLLAKMYHKSSTKELFKGYLKKTIPLAEKDKDLWIESDCIDSEIIIKSQSQKKKDLIQLREILLKKNRLTQELYHKKLSEVYNLLSGLYLDDTTILEELKGLMLEDHEINALIQIADQKPEAVKYKVAQARFNFDDKERFELHMKEAEELLENCTGTQESIEKLERRMCFLKALARFHHGETPEQLSPLTDRTLELNEKHQFTDAIAVFYHMLFQIMINGTDDAVMQEIKKHEHHFQEENNYLLEFINAYIHFLKGEYKDALWLLNDLSYAQNFYIAIWSRLLEIRIHYEKKNVGLCENLVERAIRQMDLNKGKVFNYDSNAVIITNFCRLLGVRSPKTLEEISQATVKISPFHQQIKEWIDELS